MKFSIITPTHNTQFLSELYDSLCEQTVQNSWEWVILLNGAASRNDIPESIRSDLRVRICVDDSDNKKIGFLKNKAFNIARGEILVEVDHDDILTPDCLEELAGAFQDKSVGFAYSNNAKLGDFIPYNPIFGWQQRPFKFRDKTLHEMISFEPSAATLGFIWYAPDHVRAWRASVYKKLGGHNRMLEVCDDHELLIRTYLTTKMHFINRCLYIYRITGTNTWLEKNALVQNTTKALFMQYARQLAERDADLNALEKIDLGGGLFPRKGYMTLDQEGGDVTCDLNKGIPLAKNSIGVINASHIIEHLHDKHKVMSEIYRVLADGGWAFIDVPSTDGRGAFQDPTHVSYWNQNSFLYYTQREQAQFIRNTSVRFQTFFLETHFPNQWHKDNNIPITTAWLRAVKSDKRRPHGVHI